MDAIDTRIATVALMSTLLTWGTAASTGHARHPEPPSAASSAKSAGGVELATLDADSAPADQDGDDGGAAPRRATVHGESALRFIHYLASDELGGRRSGTAGFRRAAEWAAARFREWGLEPAGEAGDYFQQVELRDFTERSGTPRLRVENREFFVDDEDFELLGGSSAGARAAGEVVFLGTGIRAPERGLDEYAGVEVSGRIALILKGSPADAPAARRMFERRRPEQKSKPAEDEWKELAPLDKKLRTAYDAGAAAVLVYDPTPAQENTSGRRWRRRAPGLGFTPERPFLAATVTERVARAILRSDPQESPRGTRRRLDALRREIRDKHARSTATGVHAELSGYDSVLVVDEEHGNNHARNVLAKIPGSDPALAQEYVVVGAHLDHVGRSGTYIRNGADDNASGSAVVLELARAFAERDFRPQRTVIFALWTGEELGLLGSRHYTDHPCDGVDMNRVAAYFNLDMVGLGDEIGAPGALNFPEIYEIICRDQDEDVLAALKPSTGGPGGSDHSGFIVRGIEALALMTHGGDGHPDYHQPEDDAEKIDPVILDQTARFVARGIENLADERETPLIIPDRKERYLALRSKVTVFDPEVKGGSWQVIPVPGADADAIRTALLARAFPSATSKEKPEETPRRSVRRGFADLRPFGGDLELLRLTARALGVGRLDIAGDDGHWIADGELTEAGRKAMAGFEEDGIVLHLRAPGDELLGTLARTAKKPFLVTGAVDISEALAERLASAPVRIGIDLDPAKPEEFVARVEELKELIGNRDLLVARVVNPEGLEKAKGEIYRALRERGWTSREICGSRRSPHGLFGGNLREIDGGGRRRRYR